MKYPAYWILMLLFNYNVVGGAVPAAIPSAAAAPAMPGTPAEAPEAYSAGSEMMKQILGSIRREVFDLNLKFDLTLYPEEAQKSPTINIFDIQALAQFKAQSKPALIPLMVPDPNATEQARQLEVRSALHLSNKYAVITLHRGTKENTYEGKMRFYSKSAGTRKLVADFIRMDLLSDLVVFKKLFLFGVDLKLELPQGSSDKDEVKKSLLKALVTCQAETEMYDLLNSNTEVAAVQKCQFSFNGEQLRIQYEDPEPSYIQ
jgi:hypothetical protein